MIRKVGIFYALAAVVAVLSGCSSENNEGTDIPQLLLGAAQQAAQQRSEGRAPPVVVTPKMLAETKIAALQVNPEMAGGSDFLRRAATRRDSYPGDVEIWKSSDNAQIFLRNGVVVATRGVGADIISSDASMTVRALQNRAANAGIRRYILSDGDVTATEVQFRCEVRLIGQENIAVVNQVFETTHLRETCVSDAAGGERITNDYWVQSGTGLVRKSRQWVGARSGYFEMILLKN
ncbi:YjbF family lipoprotein [Sulfitobacter sp. HNIBRBA3233]|uniref:YjbF family lipoprotein n=1 Tax=Sulfitobacter marinivivus TaxID=3158558 RepID=UPI0032E04E84